MYLQYWIGSDFPPYLPYDVIVEKEMQSLLTFCLGLEGLNLEISVTQLVKG